MKQNILVLSFLTINVLCKIYLYLRTESWSRDGHKVLVQITKYADGTDNPEGHVSAILGHKNDPGVDILSIIYQHGIEIEFPDEVLKEAESVPEEIKPEEIKGRRDLRNDLTITIDGADAKDLDDAISVKRLDNGHTELTVSIADVSYYVKKALR